jgi:hypothetical protein
MRGIFTIIYVLIGAAVANQHHFFTHLNTFSQVVSAVLAIVLWPLIVFANVNLHVTIR